MEKSNRYSKKSSGRGGARPGAGRPKGSGHRIRLEDLIEDVEQATDMPYTKRIAQNYTLAIHREDWARVENYDKAFLNKIIADLQSVEVTESEDTIAAKQAAFREALAKIAGINQDAK